MEKQEAVDFILERLAQNRPQDEIVYELSQRLDAPLAVLKKFVAKVETEHPNIRPEATPQPSPPEVFTSTPTYTAPAEQAPVPPSVFSAPMAQTPAASSPHTWQELPSPESGISASTQSVQQAQILEEQELHKLILDLLKKGRRRSDVTMLVCERTGMEWNQAQRLVAQVEVENYRSLSLRKNSFVVTLGILGALAGLVILLFGLAGLAPYLAFFTGAQIDLPIYLEMSPEALLGLLTTGFGLLVGGIVGVIWAIQSQASA